MGLYESRTQSWRARWVQVESDGYEFLHRLATFAHPKDDWFDGKYGGASGDGTTVCGLSEYVVMPGILSRMYCPRCPKCCEYVGVRVGDGAPFNDSLIPVDHPERQWREPAEDDGPTRAGASESGANGTEKAARGSRPEETRDERQDW